MESQSCFDLYVEQFFIYLMTIFTSEKSQLISDARISIGSINLSGGDFF